MSSADPPDLKIKQLVDAVTGAAKNHHSTLPDAKYNDTDHNPPERIQLLPPARKRNLAYTWNNPGFVLKPPNAADKNQIFDIKCGKCYFDSAKKTPLHDAYAADDCVFRIEDKCVTGRPSKDPLNPDNIVITLEKCTQDHKNQFMLIWHQQW
uniref:Uncharacterized protein n=1 Tax=Moniliophthora roreri TaxID=221103 RepID=A0A0W0FRE6_MONRR